jgi:hypoxia up-regulated 1
LTLTIQNLTKSVALLKDKFSYTDSDINVKLSTRLSASDSQVEIIKAIIDCEVKELSRKRA